jgi:phosphatidylglycerophosphate synthase
LSTIDRLRARGLAPLALAFAVVAQLGMAAGLASTVGLALPGWLAIGLWTALGYALLQPHVDQLGPAGTITLTRAVLTGGVIGLVADELVVSARPPAVLLTTLAAVALVLDAVDGLVARHTRTESALGARFDMEVDAALILALSVAAIDEVGVWVVVIGSMRLAFLAASWVTPWMRGALPPSRGRKVVAAWQGVTLAAVVSQLLPGWPAVAGAALSLALLTWSFGRDIRWLYRRHQQYL